MKSRFALPLAFILSLPIVTQAINPEQSPLRSLVFDKGDFGSKFYRIPALATAADGSVLAVADRRIENQSDLPGKIDVVARRSSDGGATWSPFIMVAEHDSIGGYGDPAVVVDKKSGDILIISTHGNGLWQKEPGHISISRSKDNGVSWLPAVDINPQIKASLPDTVNRYEAWFASSGRALQTSKGRIIFAIIARKAGVEHFPVYAVYSDDGGHSWKVSKNAATLNGDEAKVVELADGSLIMSIRNRYKGGRIFSRSTDGGVTWGESYEVTALPDPACNGDIIRYTANGKNLLLQSLPGSPTDRNNVTVYVSDDNGKTWNHKHRVVRAPSAYSSMTVLPNSNVGFLIEEEVAETNENGHHPGYRLWFTSLPIDEILR